MKLTRKRKVGVLSVVFGLDLVLAFLWTGTHYQEFLWLWSFIEPHKFMGEYPNLVHGAPVIMGSMLLFVLCSGLFFMGLGVKSIWAARTVKPDDE